MTDNSNPEQNLNSLEANLKELTSPEGELHLKFCLPSGMGFVLPAVGIREVMQQSPDRVTAIPNVSPLLLGTINLRGQVIWVADLGQFLGDTAPLRTDRAEIPVIAIEDQDMLLGLAVQEMQGMEWRSPEALQIHLNDLSDTMAPFIRGAWRDEADDETPWYLLDYVAILRSARWGA
ncbi:chemotaxis protein CheW [Picosynechococcus sp. NKBG15041c]|uniref:chemotaxis protein CheW n=1 Tax=Picosynechococcus sp. NKBG15041c TaxID=1407650 RepID=UPI000407BA6F|nr:chemotaxis protein CheW [Picosynechococcus sp. NKBG15041c]